MEMENDALAVNADPVIATEKAPPQAIALPPEKATRGFTTADLYIRSIHRRWYGGKVYGKRIVDILADAPLPTDPDAAMDAALSLLHEAQVNAPNASAKTRRGWAMVMDARVRARATA